VKLIPKNIKNIVLDFIKKNFRNDENQNIPKQFSKIINDFPNSKWKIKRLESNSDVDPTIVEVDKRRYLKMLKDKQTSVIASRTIKEILERFDKKIKDPRRTKKGSNVVKILKEYLKIECPINQASKKLNLFFKKYKINLRVQDDYFPITKNKINNLNVTFNSSFGRHLEYYTGLVFKIDIKSKSQKLNIRGGRYDSLINDLGFKKNIPAVGAAINLEKL